MNRNAMVGIVGLGIAGCSPMIDLGTQRGGGGTTTQAGADGASTSADYGQEVASCEAGAVVPASDAGPPLYLEVNDPAICLDADGVPLTPASPADIEAAMIGIWTNCVATKPMVFSRDGTFAELVSTASPPPAFPASRVLVPSNDPASSGTFLVLDASATLGAGTFQLRLTYGNGAVTLQQIIAFMSPAKLRLFEGATQHDLVPAFTNAFQNGVCGGSVGAPSTFATDSELAAALAGRWVYCTGPVSGGTESPTPFGLDIEPDGTWSALTQDNAGRLVPDLRPAYSGTFELTNGTLSFLEGGSRDAGGGSPFGVPVMVNLAACPRTLSLVPVIAPTVSWQYWPLPEAPADASAGD